MNLNITVSVFILTSILSLSFYSKQAWNVLALDGSNWQRIDLFDFQRDIEVCLHDFFCGGGGREH